MQKSPDGPERDPMPRTSRTAFGQRAARLIRHMAGIPDVSRLTRTPGPLVTPATLRTSLISLIRPFVAAERTLPVIVGVLVASASLLAVVPNTSQGTVGGAQGHPSAARIAIGGGAGAAAAGDGSGVDQQAFVPVSIPGSRETSTPAPQGGTMLDDGTLLTGYAPETTVEDGSTLLKTYTVTSGDTLTGVASKFGISMMTLYWANQLTSKDALHVGQVLKIPPVNGLVITVTASDTLDTLAATYKVGATDIYNFNRLTDPTIVVGQVLIIPGAAGAAIPVVPKVTTTTRTTSGSSGCTSCGVGGSYTGGRFTWPVIGGNNYISQYFHYGHSAIDIAAAYGSSVVAAAAGVVTFAGWKNNGGGYQVWISHGSNLYTTYNHMSAVLVHAGQSVGRGQQVGRIGMTGNATGPHLHFEVWIGPIWNGGYKVNPLRYF